MRASSRRRQELGAVHQDAAEMRGRCSLGATLGGYCSAHYAQKLPQSWIRAFVLLAGTGMTIYFFVKAYVA